MALSTVALCGDVMIGRGVDQVLPYPGPPRLWERYLDDARAYVRLAEKANGRVPPRVGFDWPWGDVLGALDAAAPDVRVLNLETSITGSADVDPDKAVHYRASPGNVACLCAARPDVCVLANNHVLDFGTAGLVETLDVLADAGTRTVGAGRDLAQARDPVVCRVGDGRRVVVAAAAAESAGVPAGWRAGRDRPGVDLLDDLSAESAAELVHRATRGRGPADVVVVSLHWGGNWGYRVSADEVDFAHRLVDGGVDVVFGHSSHHPRPVEVYRDRLILYGCGDLVNDYEGIEGYDEFRDDLRLLYLVSLRHTGALAELRMVPFQAHRLRLRHASAADAGWLRDVLDQVSRPFGTRVAADLVVRPPAGG